MATGRIGWTIICVQAGGGGGGRGGEGVRGVDGLKVGFNNV